MKEHPVSRPKILGLSLTELLVYTTIIGVLAAGVSKGVQYFQETKDEITKSSLSRQELQRVMLELQVLGAGSNSVRNAYQSSAAQTSSNGDYCFEITAQSPETFDSLFFNNAGVAAAATPPRVVFASAASGTGSASVQAAEMLRWDRALGVRKANASGFPVSEISRALSFWFKVRPDSAATALTLFDYSPDTSDANAFKIMVKLNSGPNQILVNLGLGLGDYIFNLGDDRNVRDGTWNHLIVQVSSLSSNNPPQVILNGASISTSTTLTVPINAFAGGGSTGTSGLSYQAKVETPNAQLYLGPSILSSRRFTVEEIGELQNPGKFNLTTMVSGSGASANAFARQRWAVSDSSQPARVVVISTSDNRQRKSFVLARSAGAGTDYNAFRLYKTDVLTSCPNPVSNDPVSLGFDRLGDFDCFVPKGSPPLSVTSGGAFTTACQFAKPGTYKNLESAAGENTGGGASGAVDVASRKDPGLCKLPIQASDFAAEESQGTQFAYVIMEDFDITQDLLAFGDAAWPSAMSDTSGNYAGASHTTGIAGLSDNDTRWYGYPANQVGMFKLKATQARPKSWWVDNVFSKVKYKPRSDVVASNRKVVFVLGEYWPIKTCSNLQYRSSYHFYKMEDNTRTTYAAYHHAIQQRYFGMTGYVGNIRCINEKDQVSDRVFPRDASGTLINTAAIIGAWTTYQASGAENSAPNFLPNTVGSTTRQRERVTVTGSGAINSRTFAIENPTWGTSNTDTNSPFNGDSWDNSCKRSGNGCSGNSSNDGNIQWRWIGGPRIDHNVIMLTDHTTCSPGTTNTGPTLDERKKQGCQGMNTITLNHTNPTDNECRQSQHQNKPSCLLRTQSGGNSQYGWWQPDEPNESGAFIWMGYTGSNYWDDAGQGSPGTSTQGKYLLEFGSHPWDATLPTASPYREALRNDAAMLSEERTRLDPPNVATKTVSVLNQKYCQ